jgi:hypothetical protein
MRPLVGAALLLSTSASYAQTPGTVPLQLSGDVPDLEFEVSVDRRSKGATCTAPCTLWIPPGSYRVTMRGPGVTSTTKKVKVFEPTTVEGEAGSSSTHTTGLVLGVVGTVATTIGLLGALLASTSRCSYDDGCRDAPHRSPTPWLLTAGAGLAAAGFGWSLFGTSGSSLSASPTRVAFAPNRDGAALSLSGSF